MKELFIRVTEPVFFFQFVCSFFRYGFESGMWNLMLLVPEHKEVLDFLT